MLSLPVAHGFLLSIQTNVQKGRYIAQTVSIDWNMARETGASEISS